MATHPEDPLGTVRLGDRMLAVRVVGCDPDYPDDHCWYLVDLTGTGVMPRLAEEPIIAMWPIVYTPPVPDDEGLYPDEYSDTSHLGHR